MASSAISPGFDIVHTLRAEINLSSRLQDARRRLPGYRRSRRLPALQALAGIDAAAGRAHRAVQPTCTRASAATSTFADGRTRERLVQLER